MAMIMVISGWLDSVEGTICVFFSFVFTVTARSAVHMIFFLLLFFHLFVAHG
jgi:hypothetical protein